MSPFRDHTTFVVLSFEGPDPYARAGGLGARVSELSEALAQTGFETHVFFIGDPSLPGYEVREQGRLHLHRWCQWISRYHGGGVYDGEEGKLQDWNQSLPRWIADTIISPAAEEGGQVVVLAEEWQTTAAVIALGRMRESEGWGDTLHLVWNANHFFGFERIDWPPLTGVATITTVSRYMKNLLGRLGVAARVVPNGIAEHWFKQGDAVALRRMKQLLKGRVSLAKVARYDPDKGWLAAIDAVAELKRRGQQPFLIGRGGVESHGFEVVRRARHLGLDVASIPAFDTTPEGLVTGLLSATHSDIVLLEPFLSLGQRQRSSSPLTRCWLIA